MLSSLTLLIILFLLLLSGFRNSVWWEAWILQRLQFIGFTMQQVSHCWLCFIYLRLSFLAVLSNLWRICVPFLFALNILDQWKNQSHIMILDLAKFRHLYKDMFKCEVRKMKKNAMTCRLVMCCNETRTGSFSWFVWHVWEKHWNKNTSFII